MISFLTLSFLLEVASSLAINASTQPYHYIPLDYDYGADSRVTANLKFGTGLSNKPVKTVMDTGSANIWVWAPGANISYGSPYLGFTGPCSLIVPTEYDPSTSSNARLSNETSVFSYAGNAKIVTGTQFANDTITAPGGSGPISNVQFALERNALIRIADNGSCLGVSYDKAILGLSPYTNTTSGPSFRKNLYDTGSIASNTMSMWFNAQPGVLGRFTGGMLLGGIDRSKYTGPLVRVPLNATERQIGFYVNKPTVSFRGKRFSPSQNTNCLLDSGSHADALPFDYATNESAAFYAASNGQLFDNAGFVTYNGTCESIPRNLTIGYTFAGRKANDSVKIEVPLRNYARGQTVVGQPKGSCVLSLEMGGCTFAAPFNTAAFMAVAEGEQSIGLAQGGVSREGSAVNAVTIGRGQSWDKV